MVDECSEGAKYRTLPRFICLLSLEDECAAYYFPLAENSTFSLRILYPVVSQMSIFRGMPQYIIQYYLKI